MTSSLDSLPNVGDRQNCMFGYLTYTLTIDGISSPSYEIDTPGSNTDLVLCLAKRIELQWMKLRITSENRCEIK